MSLLKKIIQGDKVTVGFRLNPSYDFARINKYEVYIGDELMEATFEAGVIRAQVLPSTTVRYLGEYHLYLSIEDSTFGVRKSDVGTLEFISSGSLTSAISTNSAYSIILLNTTISDVATVINSTTLEDTGVNVDGTSSASRLEVKQKGYAILTGTISLLTGSYTITGSGTNFASALQAGDIIYLSPDDENYYGGTIASITSDTILTLEPATATLASEDLVNLYPLVIPRAENIVDIKSKADVSFLYIDKDGTTYAKHGLQVTGGILATSVSASSITSTGNISAGNGMVYAKGVKIGAFDDNWPSIALTPTFHTTNIDHDNIQDLSTVIPIENGTLIASFDARMNLKSSYTYNHVSSFQDRPNLQGALTITDYRGFWSFPDVDNITGGTTTIGNRWAFKADEVHVTNGTYACTNNYGFYCEELTKGTNNFAVYTAGGTKSYFGGSVGIGTTIPTNILSLGGTSARTIWMERNTTAATAGQGLTISAGGAIAGTSNLAGGDLTLKSGISTGTGSSSIHFFTATAGTTGTSDRSQTEKMTILGNGNVGIGTTSPSSLLHMSGANAVFKIAQTTTGSLNTWSLGYSANNANLILQPSTNGLFFLRDKDSNFAFGFNTTTLNAGFGVIPNSTDRVLIQGSTSDNTKNALNITNSSASSILVVKNDGNVGIGYTDPQTYKLKVNGDGYFNGALTLTNGAPLQWGVGNSYISGYNDGSTGDFIDFGGACRFNNAEGDQSVAVTVDASGNLVIGGNLKTLGGLQTFGANDSAGTGYRLVRVPNI